MPLSSRLSGLVGEVWIFHRGKNVWQEHSAMCETHLTHAQGPRHHLGGLQ